MKTLFLFICFFASFALSAHEASPQFHECEKTYVDSDKIVMTNQGIYIHRNGDWLLTERIQHDQRGLFYDTVQDNEEATWVCPTCGQENSHYSKICVNCGTRRFQ